MSVGSTGLPWPALVQPYRDNFAKWFGTPECLYDSFDDKSGLLVLIESLDASLSERSRNLIADALVEWQTDCHGAVRAARRDAKRRISECLPGANAPTSSLQDHYNKLATQNPLALLPALKKRKSASERVIDKGARATEEARLKTEYALKLAGVLKEAGLPVCQIIEGVEDAEEAWQRLFGSRRAKTLRNRFRSWSSFREWLVISRGRVYPTGIPDVLDYANERYHGACGKTVLDSFQAALSIIESVGRVPDSEQLSQDPTWQAQLKSYTADLVAAAPPEQPASMFTVAILVSLELLVCLAAAPQYLRALAFICLLSVWGSLRADDVQGLLPQTMQLDERGLSVDLARSKTTGPDKRVKTIKIFVDRQVSLTGQDWLRVGVELWSKFDFKRDYMVMKADDRLEGPIEKPVNAATVALYMRKVLSELGTPKLEAGEWKLNMQRPLLPGVTASHFSGHSGRNFLSSVGAAIEIDPRELDYLGRWKVGGEGSASYIRTSRQVVHRLQRTIAEALVTGKPKPYLEADALKALLDYGLKAGESEAILRRRHSVFQPGGGLGGQWPSLVVPASQPAPSTPEEPRAPQEPSFDYFVVTSRTTGLRRLHMLGCYVKPENCYSVRFLQQVSAEDVDSICKDCKARMKAQAGQEDSDPSSSSFDSESS